MKTSVTQKHNMSCGLACVAFITGQSYELLAINETLESLEHNGFTCIGLVLRLRKAGYHYTWRKITKAKPMYEFPKGAIVFVGRSNTLPYGHWLAFSEQGWMDPWINWHPNNDIRQARAGFRVCLPGKPEYVLLPGAQPL